MQRRATITRSRGPITRTIMNVSIVLFLCGVVGSALGYYVQRETPYNTGPNDPYSVAVNPNFLQEPSQRLFWDKFGNGQGTNQVGGTGFWAMMTSKFPFLGNMFGRMELPTQYGVPNQYDVSTQYGSPERYQAQFYQAQPFQQQFPQQFGQRFVPSGRDVGLTDDAVIVTPPQVPIIPQQPVPVIPQQPLPAPEPSPVGYQYNKPQYRLDLPHK